MVSFYEIIVELPSDIDTQLPNASDHFVNWVINKEWELPEDADWDMSEVDTCQLTLGDKIQREIIKMWKDIANDPDAKYFVQLEKADAYFHLHILLDCCNTKPFVFGRYVKQMEKKIVEKVYRGVVPQIENWMRITKTKQVGGGNKIRAQSYIPAYLLPKRQPEVQWAWTNIEEYIKAVLHAEMRHSLSEAHLESVSLPSSKDQLARNESGAPIIASRCSKRYMELVDWLVEQGITSEKAWLIESKESFRSFQASSNSARQIKTALASAIQEMLLTKSAEDYLVGKDPVSEEIKENRIYKIMEMNGYDPLYVGNIFVGWSKHQFGKRNTLWLFGPATTGKTNIAEAIAHAVPFYGCVNWTNENFPFNDCCDKMIIWWEEGKMTNKIVETAKAILGGSKVRVDQKCKSSIQLDPTPVIITSNTNMCYVVDGNTTTFEHQQPLQDRMFRFELTKRLPDDFGKVTKKEVREFFKWAADNTVEVTSEFNVRKAVLKKTNDSPKDESQESRGVKRPAPSGGEDDIKPPPKRERSFCETQLPEENPSYYTNRYKLKCSRHLGWTMMKYRCLDCERVNMNYNQCMIHKKISCKECFPDYEDKEEQDIDFEPEPEPEPEPDIRVPCAIHHLMGVVKDNCPACKLKNIHLEDCDNEQ